MSETKLLDVLGDIEHTRWAHWQQYVFSQCTMLTDGNAVIPAWAVERWNRQINTPYAELSESEKEKDRHEAKVTLDAITEFSLRNI